jgi:hypothetical protein
VEPAAELAGEDRKRPLGHGFERGLILCEEEETTKLAKGLGVTTPFEIILYYHLNHSIWSLSDNKESSR